MIYLRSVLLALLVAALALAPIPTRATQGSLQVPTTGTVSGLAMATAMNAALDALTTCNSGARAPTNALVAPSLGQFWCDTSGSPTVALKQYDGTSWLVLGYFDQTNHVWKPVVGGGTSTVASATTTNLGALTSTFVTISGSVTIDSFGSSAALGALKFVKFSGALTLTNNATSMILPNGGSNIATAAGDTAIAIYLGGGGNWLVLQYLRADGTALSTNSTFTSTVAYTGVITPSTISGTTNNWAPASLAGSNRIRAISSNAATITGLTGGATGRQIIFDNVGPFTITLTSNDTNSSAANRFLIPRAVVVRPYDTVFLIYDGTSAGWRMGAPAPTNPPVGSYKNKLITTSSNSVMAASADSVVLGDSGGETWELRAFSATADTGVSGAGGIDTGSVANSKFYALWAIGNPTTNAAALMYSLSFTAPALPSGYTFAARIGANRTDSSGRFFRVRQVDDDVAYLVTAGTISNQSLFITTGPSATFSSTSPTLYNLTVRGTGGGLNCVPPTATMIKVGITSTYRNATAGQVFVAPNADWGGANNGPIGSNGNIYPLYNSGYQMSSSDWLVLESNDIWYNASDNGSGVVCHGWRDPPS